MFTYPIYKAIKQRLITIAPGFYYINQYAKGKDNTSYLVPAIYIETPKNTSLHFYGRKLLTAKDAEFKIHFISNAPFKNHDTGVQDSAIQAHENQVADIDKLMTGWNAVDSGSLILTQQFIPVNASINNVMGMHMFSVLTYKTEVYSRHLRG